MAQQPEPSPLHTAIYAAFQKAFGEPHRTVGKDHQWSLRPFSYVAAINILVNGFNETPVVWVFNPHDPNDGVRSVSIRHERDITDTIRMIEEMVQHAGRPDKGG